MNIALDWDGTVTRAEEEFRIFAVLLRKMGHKVYIVTMRYPSELGEINEWKDIVDAIIPTSRMAKREATQALGIAIDVWVDDNPEAVLKNAHEIWDTVMPEGVVDPYPKTGTFA